MRIDVVTIFPDMFPAVLGASILQRAITRRLIQVELHDLRAYTHDKRRTVDDRPYGGGPGMIMKPEPLFEAVEDLRRRICDPAGHRTAQSCQTILLSPRGEPLCHRIAGGLSAAAHLILLCGHYEGVDERVRQALADREISIGDYILTGGELPALVVIDSVARLLPGVIDHQDATREESFSTGLLEYPQYTRPAVYRAMAVPEPLVSGDHQRVARWRREQALAKTLTSRPDLVQSGQHQTTPQDRA